MSPPPGGAKQPAAEPLRNAEASRRPAETRGPAPSHLLGTIAHKAIGPFVARVNDGGIVVWITAAERGGGAELVVVPFGVDGAPLREPRIVTTVPRDATSLIVRPTGRTPEGWLVAWTALLDRGESITLIELAQDGTARGTPTELQRTSDHITWADLVPTSRGALCVWAEETAAGDANILAVPLDGDGKARGVPARVARGVERWAAVAANDGAALALVMRDKSSAAGLLLWLRLDAEGAPQAAPAAVSRDPTVSGDIDLVPFHDRWLLAWTDRTGEDPQVTLATVDASGRVQGPTRAMNAVGGSALVTLAAGTAGVAMAWESPHAHARSWHRLHLATVSGEGELATQQVTSFEVMARTPAELIAADDGFALLTTPVPACLAFQYSSALPPPPDLSGKPPAYGTGDCWVVPTFMRYDARLAPIQAEPLFVGEAHTPATLAWGLRCAGGRCVALASTADAPTPVFALDLPPRKSPFDAPMTPLSPAGNVARVAGIVTLESGQPYIDLAAARASNATLVATMTNPVDTRTERATGRSATISVRAFDGEGRALDSASILTSRALPVGRVAIAAIPLQAEGAAAWVARDDGDPQVHVARIDGHGRRIKEVQLTTAKGDASSVAIAWAGDGWLVAWVDSRDGNGEVYVAKIDRNLGRVTPDQRITRAPGDAADVSLAVGGAMAWLAWSDPRESPREGVADVYVTLLRARDAKRMGEEVRVLATAAHSRSPEIAVVGDEAFVAWIEEAPPGVDGPGAAMLAHFAASGQVLHPPRALTLGGAGRPTAIVLGASPSRAQAVIARSSRDGVTLDALELSVDGSAGPPWPVVDLDAPAPFDVALALADDALFYDDTGAAAGGHRVRRVAISW
jgi:hypothetical protein